MISTSRDSALIAITVTDHVCVHAKNDDSESNHGHDPMRPTLREGKHDAAYRHCDAAYASKVESSFRSFPFHYRRM